MVKAVLDSNQLIYAARAEKSDCEALVSRVNDFECVIPQVVLREVFRRLKELNGKDFAAFIIFIIQQLPILILDEEIVPMNLIVKYKDLGLKPADASIAAFAEFVGAEYIVSENRHFLKELKPDKFKAVSAKEFLEVLKK